MNKYIKFLIPLFFTCFIACNRKQNPPFNERLIENISKESINYPSYYSGILFFCKCQDGKTTYLNVYELREIHSKEFNNLDYKSFLNKLFNQEITIKYGNKKGFKISEEVKRQYKNMNINDFLNHYCIQISKNKYTLKSNILKSQINSIFYFCFINNYQTSFDDYGGIFVIKKMK